MADVIDAVKEKAANDPQLRSVLKRVEKGSADFKDTADYSVRFSHLLGGTLSENVLDIPADIREAVAEELLKYGYDDINTVLADVQTAIDIRSGIHIRPQKADFPLERVRQFSHSLIDPTVEDSVIKRRARSGSETITKSFHDSFIKKNAAFRNDAGLSCYIIREGSGCCKWCSDVAGKYKFGTQPSDIFRRHDNCDCTIIYDGQVLRGKKNADGSRSKTWEEVPDADGNYEPKVLSETDARAAEQRNLQQYRGVKINNSSIDNGGRSGIIEARGYIEDNFDRKISLSTMDEDLKAVNPNWRKLEGYDRNCQRCVPTYVLRKRGYNVEVLPTGQNKEIDDLLSQNPHIIWERAGSPVLPISTRGSKYFGKPEIEKYMKELPDGAMCEVRCNWNDGRDGHVFIAEKVEGKVHYIDPQTGELDVSRYFKKMQNSTTFWRIDNAQLNDELVKYCCKNA